MTVAQKIADWRKARDCVDARSNGVIAVRQITAVDRTAWNVAREPCASVDDFVSKLRFARDDCAARGVVDACVLELLTGLIEDAGRLGDSRLVLELD